MTVLTDLCGLESFEGAPLCLNGGLCLNSVAPTTACDCNNTDGFIGTVCQTPTQCDEVNCSSAGQCYHDVSTAYTQCVCNEDFNQDGNF